MMCLRIAQNLTRSKNKTSTILNNQKFFFPLTNFFRIFIFWFEIAFAQYHNKKVWTCRLSNKQNLMSNSGDNKNGRVTLWLEIDVDDWANSEKMMYQPGDHVGMLATNREELVSGIIPYLQYDQDPDESMELQMLKEKHTSTGENQ